MASSYAPAQPAKEPGRDNVLAGMALLPSDIRSHATTGVNAQPQPHERRAATRTRLANRHEQANC